MSIESFLSIDYDVQTDELRKIIRLYVLQDEKLEFNWNSHIYHILVHGRYSHRTLRSMNNHVKWLNSTQRILNEQLRHFAFIFIHSQDIVHSEVSLSSHFKGEWRRVKIVNQKNPNTFINYMMFVPDCIEFWKSKSVYWNLEELIGNLYCNGILWFDKLKETFPSMSIPSLSEDFLNGVKVQSIMNLVYIKEVGHPCVLFPEEVGIRLEFDDFAMKVARHIPVASHSLSSQSIFIESQHCVKKGYAGRGASGICNILELSENVLKSSEKFVSKEISTAPLATTDSYSDAVFYPRSQILEEIAIMCSINTLEIPYIIKQFTIAVDEIDDLLGVSGNSHQSLILYNWAEGEIKFCSTMEFINGTDLRNVDVASLDELTKFSIVLHVTETLNVLHENGFVHNDLHLGNMRLESSTNRIVILDFGCCERITENGIRKNVKDLFKLIDFLYSMQCTGCQQHNDVPDILRPIIEDARKNKNLSKRKYKTVSDILQGFSIWNEGIVLDRKWLDFGYFLICLKFYHSDSFQDFMKLAGSYEGMLWQST